MPAALGLIAGNGIYPRLVAAAARAAGVGRIVAAAFEGETGPELAALVDETVWLRVGQLGRLIAVFRDRGIREAIMAGQISPKNLFDLRPDIKAIMVLARLRRRNAETIFGAIADELARAGTILLPATTFMERHLAGVGRIAGPPPRKRDLAGARFGLAIAREISRLDIGQTVVVRNGTVLAVEGFEGTNEAIRRGGGLARKDAVVVKVAKPDQDFRFDVPVIGPETLRAAADGKVAAVAVEAGRTLVLEREAVERLAAAHAVAVFGVAG